MRPSLLRSHIALTITQGCPLVRTRQPLFRVCRGSAHRPSAAHGALLLANAEAAADPAVPLGPDGKPSIATTTSSPRARSTATLFTAAGAGAAGWGPARQGKGVGGEEAGALGSTVVVAPSLLSLLGQAERRLLARTDAVALAALSQVRRGGWGRTTERGRPQVSWA